jgi:hypothetical protein
MAIIKTIRNYVDVSLVFEDPQPGSDNFFIQTDAFSKTTLNPIINGGIIYTTNGSVISNTFGYSGVGQNSSVYTWRVGGILQLNGEVTHVRQNPKDYLGTTNVFGVIDRPESNIDVAPFISMDTNYRVKPSSYFTDGINNMVISCYNYSVSSYSGALAYNNHITPYVLKINTTPSDLLNSGFMTQKGDGTGGTTVASGYANFGSLALVNSGGGAWPIYRNPSTNNLVWASTHWYNYPGAMMGGSWKPAFSSAPTIQAPSTGYNVNYSGQFLGVSKVDGYTLYFHNAYQFDYNHFIYKYNDNSNTYSTLNTYSVAPYPSGLGQIGQYIVDRYNGTVASVAITSYPAGTASGTGRIEGNVLTITAYVSGSFSTGTVITGTGITVNTTISPWTTSTITTGDRTTTYGTYIPRYASKTFTDTVTTTVTNAVGFYAPLIDVTGKFHPMYFNWDQTRDYVARYTDIGVYYSTGTFSTYWAHDTASSAGLNVTHALQRVWYNETFLGNDGRRYLTFMQLHGAGGLFDTNDKQRTFVTYQISTSSYRSLTYHSSVAIPSTPKNICWLNDGRTLLAVVGAAATYIYNFNTSTGWVNTVTFPYSFTAIGRDNLGRVWATDTGAPAQWGRLHLLSNVPASVAVVSSASSYTYAGTAIPTTFSVDAYDLTGSRMTATVNLSVVGNSLKFTTSTSSTNYLSSLTVVTNTSTSTIAYGSVISNGYSNITTTFVI